jgi:hypothetical protein
VRVFLSGVQSVAHLLYASSYLGRLIEDSGASATLVDLGVGQFLGRANVSAQDLREMLGKDPRLTVVGPGAADLWRSEPGERCIYIGVGAPGIKPYLRLRRAQPLRKLHVVVIDEGIGSYGNWRTKRDAMRRQGGSEPWLSIRSLAVTAARVLLTDERWALYRRVGREWSVDDRVAAAFRSQVPLPDSRPRVGVFLSQPWVELGMITEVAYLAHVREMAEACSSAGFTFLVCPHPAEPLRRYADFSLTLHGGPAELDPQVVGAALVIGATSSAMLNVAALYGTPAFRVVPPELSHLDSELSARQRSLFSAFLPVARPVSALSRLLSEQG